MLRIGFPVVESGRTIKCGVWGAVETRWDSLMPLMMVKAEKFILHSGTCSISFDIIIECCGFRVKRKRLRKISLKRWTEGQTKCLHWKALSAGKSFSVNFRKLSFSFLIFSNCILESFIAELGRRCCMNQITNLIKMNARNIIWYEEKVHLRGLKNTELPQPRSFERKSSDYLPQSIFNTRGSWKSSQFLKSTIFSLCKIFSFLFKQH